jgi:hypothetical protein
MYHKFLKLNQMFEQKFKIAEISQCHRLVHKPEKF